MPKLNVWLVFAIVFGMTVLIGRTLFVARPALPLSHLELRISLKPDTRLQGALLGRLKEALAQQHVTLREDSKTELIATANCTTATGAILADGDCVVAETVLADASIYGTDTQLRVRASASQDEVKAEEESSGEDFITSAGKLLAGRLVTQFSLKIEEAKHARTP